MAFNNTLGITLDVTKVEVDEQLAVDNYITSSDVVLELGARCGIVSCKLNRVVGANLVSVEPDTSIHSTLEANILANGLTIKLEKSAISKVPLNSVPQLTFDALQTKYSLTFTTLVAFYQPFLEFFFQENPILYSQLTMVVFNRTSSSISNFSTIVENLSKNGFGPVQTGYVEVWKKGYVPPPPPPQVIPEPPTMFNPNLKK